MIKAFWMLKMVTRISKVAWILSSKYNFDIDKDKDTIMLIGKLIDKTKLKDEQIALVVLKRYSVDFLKKDAA